MLFYISSLDETQRNYYFYLHWFNTYQNNKKIDKISEQNKWVELGRKIKIFDIY